MPRCWGSVIQARWAVPRYEVWADVWPVCGPQANAVLNEGKSTWNEELLLIMERNGFTEEAYFTFSYSPVMDDSGQPGGIFCAVTEETARVLGRRRLKTLRDLGERALVEATTDVQACRAAAKTLSENLNDFPFALIYLLDAEGRRCHLCDTVNYPREERASPSEITLAGERDVWNFQNVLKTNRGELVEDLDERFGSMPAGPWKDDDTKRALVLPLAKAGVQDLPAGFLVAGLSPAPGVQRRLSWVPGACGGPFRHGDRQRARLSGGAQASGSFGGTRSREDRFFQQCEPRISHTTDADAWPPGRVVVRPEWCACGKTRSSNWR